MNIDATIDSAHYARGSQDYLRIDLSPNSHRPPEWILDPTGDWTIMGTTITAPGEIDVFIRGTRYPRIVFSYDGAFDGGGAPLDKITSGAFSVSDRAI